MRWLLLVSLLLSAALNAQTVSSQTAESEGSSFMDANQDTVQMENSKSPALACVLSLVGGATILPGLGQHYNGEHKKGWYMGAIWLGGMAAAVGTVGRDNEKTGQAIGIPLILTAWLWSCIDAPLSANKINKRSRQQIAYGHILEFHRGQFVIGADLKVADGAIRPTVTIHF